MSDAFQSTFDYYLRERGISTKRASMMTGISYDCIRRCRIQGIFSVRHLLTICTAFGVSSDYLLGLTEEKIMPATYREFFYVLRFMMDQQMILRQLVCDDATTRGFRDDRKCGHASAELCPLIYGTGRRNAKGQNAGSLGNGTREGHRADSGG